MIATLDRPPSASLFIALFLTLFSAVFNYTLSIMASPYIVGDLGGSNDITTYTVSFYALGNALGIPLGRGLIPRIGAAKLIVITMTLFAFFSLTCAIAPNYPFFNASRFLQGFVSGPFYGLTLYFLSRFEPKEKKAFFASISLMIFTVGPVFGACVGGSIAYEWSWRWLFYINAPLLLILALFLRYRLKGFGAVTEENPPFDGIGYLFYFISIFCLCFAVIMGQELDWHRSPFILSLGAIGIPSLVFLVLWELNHPNPVICLRLLKHPLVVFALFNLAILFSAYFGMIVLLSLWLKLWANYTPNWIAALLGIMMLTAPIPFLLGNTRIARIDSRILLAVAIVFLIISNFYTTSFDVDINLGRIIISRVYQGLGLALFLSPLLKLCFSAIHQEDTIAMFSMFQVVRALSSGLGASIYATIWLRRQVFFHERLGGDLTAASPLTQQFFVNAGGFGLHGERANAQLEYYLEREATSLALDDCFYLMAWILVGLLLSLAFTFFARCGSFVTARPNPSL